MKQSATPLRKNKINDIKTVRQFLYVIELLGIRSAGRVNGLFWTRNYVERVYKYGPIN